MIVRKFEASSMEQALARIKGELGSEALILETRQIAGSWFRKGSVEVTAALQTKPASQEKTSHFDDEQLAKIFPHRRSVPSPKHASGSEESDPSGSIRKTRMGRYRDLMPGGGGGATSPTPRGSERESGRERGRRTQLEAEAPRAAPTSPYTPEKQEQMFLESGFSPESARDFARQLIFDYSKEDRADRALMNRVKSKMLAAGIKTLHPGIFDARRCWTAVGTAGAGKTSLLVKLGLYLKQNDEAVSLVSCDRRKVIGKQELAAYAKLIRASFSTDPKSDKTASKVTLIDTPSLVWQDSGVQQEIETVCRDASTVLVLDASQRVNELLATVEKTARFAPVAIAFTRLDAISQTGVVYEVLKHTKLPLLGLSLSHSFRVPFTFFEPLDLARFLLGAEEPKTGNA